MIRSVTEMSRAVRRRLERVVKKSGERDYARRALALLQPVGNGWECRGVSASSAIGSFFGVSVGVVIRDLRRRRDRAPIARSGGLEGE